MAAVEKEPTVPKEAGGGQTRYYAELCEQTLPCAHQSPSFHSLTWDLVVGARKDLAQDQSSVKLLFALLSPEITTDLATEDVADLPAVLF